MKKLLLIMSIMAIALPAVAVCSVTGETCSAYSISKPMLQDKYLPNNLQSIQKPTAFTPKYFAPYDNALINTETGGAAGSSTPNYNSNCQFGVCLPGVAPNTGGTVE